jgi:hypothetical protein
LLGGNVNGGSVLPLPVPIIGVKLSAGLGTSVAENGTGCCGTGGGTVSVTLVVGLIMVILTPLLWGNGGSGGGNPIELAIGLLIILLVNFLFYLYIHTIKKLNNLKEILTA